MLGMTMISPLWRYMLLPLVLVAGSVGAVPSQAGPHSVAERPTLSGTSVAHRSHGAERYGRSEAELLRYLRRNRSRMDPIEGIWYTTEGHRMAVVRDRSRVGRDFVAVLLTDTPSSQPLGEILAEFRMQHDGSYAALLLGGSQPPKRFTVAPSGNSLLHLPPLVWRREYPVHAYAQAAPVAAVRPDPRL
jgi:hypothetical protein